MSEKSHLGKGRLPHNAFPTPYLLKAQMAVAKLAAGSGFGWEGISGGSDLPLPTANAVAAGSAFERHYRISDLARLWGLGRETVRKLVKDDPGVIKIRMGRRKAHTIYSVPESAALRIHTRLLNAA
jgi:hypothetical protein